MMRYSVAPEQTESGEIVGKWGYHHGNTKLPFYDVPPSSIFLSFGAYISLQKFIVFMKLHSEWSRRPITCLEGGRSRYDPRTQDPHKRMACSAGPKQPRGSWQKQWKGAGDDMNVDDNNNNQRGEDAIYRYNLLHVLMCIFPH